MPYLRVEVTGPIEPAVRRELLTRTAELFAEITESPIERIRTEVLELSPDSFAVGGAPISESGELAPFIAVEVLAGRPLAQHTALIERVSPLVAEILGARLDRTRLRITEIQPEDWGIAGVPAAAARRDEIETRAGG